MTAIKVGVSALTSIVVLAVVTFVYLLVAVKRLGLGPGVGLDVVLIPRLTIYSPMYWVVVIVVMGGLWWGLSKLLFAK
jgi:hypothetical protein